MEYDIILAGGPVVFHLNFPQECLEVNLVHLLQTLGQLKSDNHRLREENLSLIRVISKLSGNRRPPGVSNFILYDLN